MQKTRPCLLVSRDEMNIHLQTVLIAALTTTIRSYATRVPVTFQGRHGQVSLDQIRAVDRPRLVRKLGHAPSMTAHAVSAVLVEMCLQGLTHEPRRTLRA